MVTTFESDLMVIPTVHLNGTSGEALFNEYRAAINAVGKAKEALMAITTHGRDYYPQGDKAFYAAMEQRTAWRNALNKIEADLIKIALAVQDQTEERKR